MKKALSETNPVPTENIVLFDPPSAPIPAIEPEGLRAALVDLVKWASRFSETGRMADEIAMRASIEDARDALAAYEREP